MGVIACFMRNYGVKVFCYRTVTFIESGKLNRYHKIPADVKKITNFDINT